jgi:hypothetical protein
MQVSVLTIDTTATPPELADGFGVAHSAGWRRRSNCPKQVSVLTLDTLGTGNDDQERDPASRIASAQRSARRAGLENLLQFGN